MKNQNRAFLPLDLPSGLKPYPNPHRNPYPNICSNLYPEPYPNPYLKPHPNKYPKINPVVYVPPNMHKMKNKTMKNRCLRGRTKNILLDLRFQFFRGHFLGRTNKRLKSDKILKDFNL